MSDVCPASSVNFKRWARETSDLLLLKAFRAGIIGMVN
jgi:hypothetical protein